MSTPATLRLTQTLDIKKAIFATDTSWGLLILRLALAIVIFPHGAQKLFGWFGGFGFAGTMNFFTETMGIPYVLGFLAIVAEFLGPLALAAGFLSRISAFGIGFTMFVAMMTSHIQHGFFMNWYGSQAGEGIEFFILAIAISAAIAFGGGGAASVDRTLFDNGQRRLIPPRASG